MADHVLQCTECEQQYSPDEVEYLCPTCGKLTQPMQPLRGVLRVVYDYDAARHALTLKHLSERAEVGAPRYCELMPVNDVRMYPPLRIGRTPLYPVARLREQLGMPQLWIKDDAHLPTFSLKDRATQVVVACARERGCRVIAAASTGNTASSLAGIAASVGLPSVIFAPATAPAAKLAQIAICGATLIPIDDTFDRAYDLSIDVARERGFYLRNTVQNPYTVEGKKTVALELWEQMGGMVPDWIVAPVGDGCIIAALQKGFEELKLLGFIDRIPRLAAIQEEGCSPVVDALQSGAPQITPVLKPSGIADSIRVGVPRGGIWALRSLRETNGVGVAVSAREILSAIAMLASATGLFAEPAAATSIAGLLRLRELEVIASEESVVLLLTGAGLKDISAAERAVDIPKPVAPDVAAILKRLDQ